LVGFQIALFVIRRRDLSTQSFSTLHSNFSEIINPTRTPK